MASAASQAASQAATTAPTPVARQLLFYTYVPNMLERRAPVRALHLEHAQAAVARGELVAGGAFAPAIDGGLLIFDADRAAVETFARQDPYVKHQLVVHWEVKEWLVVAGTPPTGAART